MSETGFYVFESRNALSKTLPSALPVNGFRVGEADECPRCHSPVSLLEWLPPFEVEISNAHYATAIFGTVPFLVDAAFRHAYMESELKGIADFRDVKIVKIGRKRHPEIAPPSYFLPTIASSQARIDRQASQYTWDRNVSLCGECGGELQEGESSRFLGHFGYRFEQGTWSGEDIFYPKYWKGALVFVTEHFRQWWEMNGFTGTRFVPAELCVPSWMEVYEDDLRKRLDGRLFRRAMEEYRRQHGDANRGLPSDRW